MLDGADGFRERVVDEQNFRPDPDDRRLSAGSFRLQFFVGPSLRPVAVATQDGDGWEGMSLTNAADQYAEAVWREFCPREVHPPIWIENYTFEGEGKYQLKIVKFDRATPYELSGPDWTVLTVSRLERLVGQRVDLTRGDGYIRRLLPPEPVDDFMVFPVDQLPETKPFRARCMQGPRARSTPGDQRACCWYHSVDWIKVNEVGVPLVEAALTDGLTYDELKTKVEEEAHEALNRRQLDAWACLLCDPIHLGRDADGWSYTNGQHRAQAMKDQGVQRTIVTVAAQLDEA